MLMLLRLLLLLLRRPSVAGYASVAIVVVHLDGITAYLYLRFSHR
jgi:hypothetical protein